MINIHNIMNIYLSDLLTNAIRATNRFTTYVYSTMASAGPTATLKICYTQKQYCMSQNSSIFCRDLGTKDKAKMNSVLQLDLSVKEKDTSSNGCALDSPQCVYSDTIHIHIAHYTSNGSMNLQSDHKQRS